MTKQKIKEAGTMYIDKKRERTRNEILSVARKILYAQGVGAVKLTSVSSELGLTKQALYHYFSSKEELIKSLITSLLDEEINFVLKIIIKSKKSNNPLGKMIQAFYDHYINNLDAFRTVYCLSQLYNSEELGFDDITMRENINKLTRNLFDTLEERLSTDSMTKTQRKEKRQLAYTAWLAALGLITMLGVSKSTNDPLIHSDKDLLKMMCDVFNNAANT